MQKRIVAPQWRRFFQNVRATSSNKLTALGNVTDLKQSAVQQEECLRSDFYRNSFGSFSCCEARFASEADNSRNAV